MPRVLQFDPKNISIVIGGQLAHGLADGTFLTVERNEQAYNLKIGSDGEGTRAKSNNKSGKITLTLMQSSSYNDYLTGLTIADESSNTGVVPVLIKDNLGTTLITALTAWVQKFPNMEDAHEVSHRVWVLESDEINMFVGGNVSA